MPLVSANQSYSSSITKTPYSQYLKPNTQTGGYQSHYSIGADKIVGNTLYNKAALYHNRLNNLNNK